MKRSISIVLILVLGLSFSACGGGGGDDTPLPQGYITHNGVNYKEVTSPYTQKVWLDRNLGASQACTALDDTACYGDYYQWGRNADGHENNESNKIATQATDINNVGHSDFITSSGAYHYEWLDVNNNDVDDNGSLRTINWSKTDGSSVCPVGFRVPTIQELKDETLDNTGGGCLCKQYRCLQ